MNGWKISGLYPFNPAVVLNNTTLVPQQAIPETSERGTTRLSISGKVISTAEMIRELTEREAKKKQDKVRRDARAAARNLPSMTRPTMSLITKKFVFLSFHLFSLWTGFWAGPAFCQLSTFN